MDDEFKKFIIQKKYTIKRELFFNPVKLRYSVVIEDENDKLFFLKWNSKEPSYKKYLSLLNNEISAYRRGIYKGYVPKLIEFGENYIITEYIEGVTLREYLCTSLSGNAEVNVSWQFKKIILQIVDLFKNNYIVDSERDQNRRGFYTSLRAVTGRLATSGPNRDSLKGVKKLFLRIYSQLIKFRMKLLIYRETDFRKGFVHNDFHLNNIIIDANHNVFIIDLEKCANGYVLADMLYAHNLIRKQVSKNINHHSFLETKFWELFKSDERYCRFVKNIDDLLYLCVQKNNKF